MRSITALSIANDAIRAAVIADPYSDLPTIKHLAIPLPNGAVVDGEVVDHDVVAGLLNTLVKRFQIPPRGHGSRLLQPTHGVSRGGLSHMSLNDLKSTLPFQAKGMIPLPTEESELDFVPLNVIDSEQGKQLHGILVATLRNGLKNRAHSRRRGICDHIDRCGPVRACQTVRRHQPAADRSGGQHQRQRHRRDRARKRAARLHARQHPARMT